MNPAILHRDIITTLILVSGKPGQPVPEMLGAKLEHTLDRNNGMFSGGGKALDSLEETT